MNKKHFLGFDFGASSGRAMLATFDGAKIEIEEIHRFSNDPVMLCGRFVWDIPRLVFEMKQALNVPLDAVRKAEVLCGTGKLGGVLEKAVSFPYAQHMLSDAPGQRTHYGSEEALREAVEKVRFDRIKTLVG